MAIMFHLFLFQVSPLAQIASFFFSLYFPFPHCSHVSLGHCFFLSHHSSLSSQAIWPLSELPFLVLQQGWWDVLLDVVVPGQGHGTDIDPFLEGKHCLGQARSPSSELHGAGSSPSPCDRWAETSFFPVLSFPSDEARASNRNSCY